ncbi:MAG: hypothetical protein K2L89_08435 [Muribaculaceae bacterium]|nr:hypothetical protein [Muribaculaceae bacterium]
MTMKPLLESTRRPDIEIRRNGRISLSARIVRILTLEPGDTVSVDIENGEYYLSLRARAGELIGRHHARCYPANRNSSHYRLSSVRLATSLLHACGITGNRASLICGEPVTIQGKIRIPIITKTTIR